MIKVFSQFCLSERDMQWNQPRLTIQAHKKNEDRLFMYPIEPAVVFPNLTSTTIKN